MDDAARHAVKRLAATLRPWSRVLFVTGAGLSADSGLPTYRGVGGLYDAGRGARHGFTIEEALSGPVMRSRPEVTWEFLHELERHARGAAPNRGHDVIAAMQDHFDGVWVLTQNVDGLHRAAGSRDVIDIHGDLHDLRCTSCTARTRVDDYSALDPLPHCPRCGAVVRPDVVLFGEMLPQDKLATLRRELDRGFDVVISVGTSGRFPYIVEPTLLALDAGRPTYEIDPGETEISRLVSIKITARAAEALDALARLTLPPS
jgi:NAD-dependent deacetylase